MKTITFTQEQLENMIYIDQDGVCRCFYTIQEDIEFLFEQKDGYVAAHLCSKQGTEIEVIDTYVVYSSKF